MILEVSVHAECDQCDEEITLELNTMSEYSFRQMLQAEGWSWPVGSVQKMLCPDCQGEE
jgi:hypothetical protein